MQPLSAPQPDVVFSVQELNAACRDHLEQHLGQLWVSGELSSLARPSSGHLYFTLKDDSAQVRCAFFRPKQRGLWSQLENGQQVLVLAQVSLYEARGDYQLIIKHLELAGDGALQRAFLQLKQKMEQEGLFAAEHKKTIPAIPRCIGVVTSASGAAIRDVLHVLARRYPCAPVIIYPTSVQGNAAATQIAQAIATANHRRECDVLIVTRGGGSLEDLWPFNEEIVARAIFECDIPIVSAIGHEVDFTIADFVADQRAPTPSAAAEIVSPDRTELNQLLSQRAKTLQHLMQNQLRHWQQQCQHLAQRLRHPGDKLRDQMQRLDQLEQSLWLAMKHILYQARTRLSHLCTKHQHQHPQQQLDRYRDKLTYQSQQLQRCMQQSLQLAEQRLTETGRALHAVSPLSTLQRGYAIVQEPNSQHIIRYLNQVKIGQPIKTRVSDGEFWSQVINAPDSEP